MEINQKIMEVIRQHLPEASVDELRKQLNELESLRNDNARMKKELEEAGRKINRLTGVETENLNLRKQLDDAKAIIRDNELKASRSFAESQKEKCDAIFSLVDKLFSGHRRRIVESGCTPMLGGNNYIESPMKSNDRTETEE